MEQVKSKLRTKMTATMLAFIADEVSEIDIPDSVSLEDLEKFSINIVGAIAKADDEYLAVYRDEESSLHDETVNIDSAG